MDYERSFPIHNNPAQALEAVRDYLIGHHFEIHEATASTIQARRITCSGLQHSTKAFSEITARVDGNTLLLNARPRRLHGAVYGLLLLGAIFLIASLVFASVPLYLNRGQLHHPNMFIWSRLNCIGTALSGLGSYYILRTVERQAFNSFSNEIDKLC